MVKVYAVVIGDKYRSRYEQYVRPKLNNIELITSNEYPFINQWNKLRFFSLDIDEPVCVIDVDIELVNDYKKIFEYPIERGEFLTLKAHWKDSVNDKYTINGGFYKFYPSDTRYITEKFLSDPRHWFSKYIKEGTTVGPINGEQYFVEDAVKEQLSLKYAPEDWAQRGIEGQYIDDGEVKIVHHSFVR